MSFTHHDVLFEGLHGTFTPGPIEPRIQVDEFPGVRGVTTLSSPSGSRPLSVDYTISGFATRALILAHIDAINRYIGQLTGDILSDVGESFLKCTLVGYQHEVPFLDGSGVHGWVARGRLMWIQRDPAAPP